MKTINLKNYPLFSDLPDTVLEALQNAMIKKTIAAKDVLFYQEDEGVDFFIVSHGAVRIERLTSDGKRLLFSILGPGEIFGEMALITGQPRMADAVAHSDCTLYTMQKSEFQKIIAAHSEISSRLMSVLSTRLLKTSTDIERIGLSSLQNRLAAIILDLLKRFEHKEKGVINLKLTQTDLADLTVSSREHINKILQAWKAGGVIDIDKGFIQIHDLDMLMDLQRGT